MAATAWSKVATTAANWSGVSKVAANWSHNAALDALIAAATLYDAAITYDGATTYYDGYNPTSAGTAVNSFPALWSPIND